MSTRTRFEAVEGQETKPILGYRVPLPTTVRAFIFIERRLQPLLPFSTRIELRVPTLLRKRSQQLLPLIFDINTSK